MRSYRVADWMSAPVAVVEPSSPLAVAQRLMEDHHVRRLPVVDQGRLVGVISWPNLLSAQRAVARHQIGQLRVADGMTHDPPVVAPDVSVSEVARLLVDLKLGALPVVDQGRLVGVITESDLFALLHSEVVSRASANGGRTPLICSHCGMPLRGRAIDLIAPDDQCPRCHYHLHRCENCRYFDGVACMLNKADRHTGVPGQHCAAFAYVQPRAVGSGE